MIKTYISALLVACLAVAQTARSQDDLDDVFGSMGGDDAGSTAMDTMPAAEDVPAADIESDATAPVISEEETLAMLESQGKALYSAGKYAESIRLFDAMLAMDPYNSKALSMKKRASRRISSIEVKKQGATKAEAFAETKAAWNPEPKVLGSVVAADKTRSPEQAQIDNMIARLKAVNIERLDFDNTGIEEVVLFLTEQSRQLDAAGKGVNIMLVGMDDAEGERSVTTVITDISLFDALQVVTEMASLKFEVKPGAVAIMPANYIPVSEMVMRSYDIAPEVGEDLESYSSDGGGVEDIFGDPTAAAASGPVDVAGFFSIVEFPAGAKATYRPRFHKLFVKNTPANLRAIESVLADLNDRAMKSRSQQVEIEAKFVEFNEGSLEELGFDWTIYGSGSVAGLSLKNGTHYQPASGYSTLTATTPAAAGPLFSDPVTGTKVISDPNGRPGVSLFGTTQRYNGDVGGGGVGGAFEQIQSGLLKSMGGTPASMLFTNGDIDLRITAMEQQGTADVLSAPRVTTKSGTEAIIRVAETHRYPQDYDVETGQRTAPVIKPQDWEDRDLGVSLRVTPMVDEQGDTIDLELQPEIIDFRGFDPYIVGYNTQTPGENGTPIEDPTLYAQMAYFERRFINTQVTIADGHTVMMGGLVDERTETFRDQVPFLGDIPFIGRLFRTEGSRSAKKNLTIFVKATQVDVNGMTSAERKLALQ